jgi:hypothetical protein
MKKISMAAVCDSNTLNQTKSPQYKKGLTWECIHTKKSYLAFKNE